MKTSPGMKLLLALLSLVAVASGAAAIRLTLAVGDLEGRAAATRRKLEELTAAVLGKEERSAVRGGAALADAAGAPGDLDAVMLKLQALSRRLDALESGDIDELGIEEVIDNRLQKKMATAMIRHQNRVPLDAIAGSLGMTEEQKKRAADIVNASKKSVAELLETKGADGRSMADRLAGIAKGPGNRADKSREAFQLMSGTNVPGRDESYVSAIVGIREDAVAEFKSNLTEEQLSQLQGSPLKLFGIDTGYSPVNDGMRDALGGGGR